MGLLLTAVAIGYGSLLVAVYFQLTPPSSLFPDLRELDRLITARPVSKIEQLLEAGGDQMNGGGTMRPAFTLQSIGWEDAVRNLTEDEKGRLLQQREGERLALLDWVRSGASRDAYSQDDYLPSGAAKIQQITAAYRVSDPSADVPAAAARVRIRSLIADRCVTCHGENGRHDTARFIPLDSYEQLEPRLRPESPGAQQKWVAVALVGLLPLALVFGVGYWHTSHPLLTRSFTLTLTGSALGVMLACWLLGGSGAWSGRAIAVAAALATLGTALHAFATLNDLLFDMRPPRDGA